MEKQTAEMIDNKIKFLSTFERALKVDKDRNSLHSINYKIVGLDEECNHYEEFIEVRSCGTYKSICVTGNSNSANAKAIIKAIY